jgi:3-oxoacyl-[acyl-carrier-protein] synthase II
VNDVRVVVTGLGAVTSVGNTVSDAWNNVLAGNSGIGPITQFDATDFRTRIAASVKDFDVNAYAHPKVTRRLDLFCHYALGAAAQAVAHAGLDVEAIADPNRFGVLVGSGIGGLITLEEQHKNFLDGGPGKVSPFLIPRMISDMASGAVSMQYGARGPNFGIVSACASGTHSIGEAFWAIKRGDADVMLTGGAEACITDIGVAGFCAIKAMTTRNDEPLRASRPFDKDRDGFVIAEGAGVLCVETLDHAQARGAEIICEILGYGATGDAYHLTAPRPDAAGAIAAIETALRHAKLNPTDVTYVNAHGTSTQLNDKGESMALKHVLGEYAYKVPVSSTKSLTGHALGAAGAIETVFCAKAIETGNVPGTWNYETPDPDCDLDYVPNQSREHAVDGVLNMNFGFGGHNAVLAMRAFT